VASDKRRPWRTLRSQDRSYGHRIQLTECTSPRRSTCYCIHEAAYFIFPAAKLLSCLSPAGQQLPTHPPPFFSRVLAAFKMRPRAKGGRRIRYALKIANAHHVSQARMLSPCARLVRVMSPTVLPRRYAPLAGFLAQPRPRAQVNSGSHTRSTIWSESWHWGRTGCTAFRTCSARKS
jgi:hypothetical protein